MPMMMSTLGQNFDDGERLAVASESNQEVPPQEMKQCHSQCPLSSCCTGKWGRGGYSCFCCPVRSCAWTMCRYHCAFDCCCCYYCYCSSSTFCSSGAHYFRCIACERSDFWFDGPDRPFIHAGRRSALERRPHWVVGILVFTNTTQTRFSGNSDPSSSSIVPFGFVFKTKPKA